MKLGVVTVVLILSTTKAGAALQCYACTTTLGLPGDISKTSGCSPGELMDPNFLKDCDQNDTYCNIHKITAKLMTGIGVLTTVAYQLKCASSPSAICEQNVFNISSVQYSEGCHKSCQTDGCNSLAPDLLSSTTSVDLPTHRDVTEISTFRPNEGVDLGVLLGTIAAGLVLIGLIVVAVILLRRKRARNSHQPDEVPAELATRKPHDSAPGDSVKYDSINDDTQFDSDGLLITETDATKLRDSSPQFADVPLQETTDKSVA